jgi:hypothetical protein
MNDNTDQKRCAWAAQLLGLLAVCRARDRGELPWQLDVRRASARIDAQRAVARAQRARSTGQEREGSEPEVLGEDL